VTAFLGPSEKTKSFDGFTFLISSKTLLVVPELLKIIKRTGVVKGTLVSII
jgi:hypothetical protein